MEITGSFVHLIARRYLKLGIELCLGRDSSSSSIAIWPLVPLLLNRLLTIGKFLQNYWNWSFMTQRRWE